MTLADVVAVTVNDRRAAIGTGAAKVGDVEVALEPTGAGSGTRLDWSVRNPSRATVTLQRVGVHVDAPVSRVLEHGMQSWSPVRRCSPSDVEPQRLENPDWVLGYHFADPDAAGRAVHGDQFLVCDRGVAGFLDGREHLGTVTTDGERVTAWCLLDGIPLAPGESRDLDPLWLADGPPGPLYAEFADRWGAEMGARIGAPPPLGWCSWYEYFAEVTPAAIRANLALARAHGVGVVQIDDGWQAAIGDWLATAPGWGEPLAVLAGEIADAGLRPGVWTAPFLAGEHSTLASAHPDWTVGHRPSGRPLRAMWNQAWGGWAWALDTTRPEVIDHLRRTYAELAGQGFAYHKIDFCYAAALVGRRHDPTKTRAQALRAGLEAVREGIGDDAFLVGCGCPFGAAVGVVDAMRVSADVAPTWLPEASWPGLPETAPSARNAIMASVLRAPLHRRVWINDPDCVLLRPTGTGLDAAERRLLADTVAGCGAFVVLSDALTRYGAAEWAEVSALAEIAAGADSPLTLDDPFDPAPVVRSARTELTIDWERRVSTVRLPG